MDEAGDNGAAGGNNSQQVSETSIEETCGTADEKGQRKLDTGIVFGRGRGRHRGMPHVDMKQPIPTEEVTKKDEHTSETDMENLSADEQNDENSKGTAKGSDRNLEKNEEATGTDGHKSENVSMENPKENEQNDTNSKNIAKDSEKNVEVTKKDEHTSETDMENLSANEQNDENSKGTAKGSDRNLEKNEEATGTDGHKSENVIMENPKENEQNDTNSKNIAKDSDVKNEEGRWSEQHRNSVMSDENDENSMHNNDKNIHMAEVHRHTSNEKDTRRDGHLLSRGASGSNFEQDSHSTAETEKDPETTTHQAEPAEKTSSIITHNEKENTESTHSPERTCPHNSNMSTSTEDQHDLKSTLLRKSDMTKQPSRNDGYSMEGESDGVEKGNKIDGQRNSLNHAESPNTSNTKIKDNLDDKDDGTRNEREKPNRDEDYGTEEEKNDVKKVHEKNGQHNSQDQVERMILSNTSIKDDSKSNDDYTSSHETGNDKNGDMVQCNGGSQNNFEDHDSSSYVEIGDDFNGSTESFDRNDRGQNVNISTPHWISNRREPNGTYMYDDDDYLNGRNGHLKQTYVKQGECTENVHGSTERSTQYYHHFQPENHDWQDSKESSQWVHEDVSSIDRQRRLRCDQSVILLEMEDEIIKARRNNPSEIDLKAMILKLIGETVIGQCDKIRIIEEQNKQKVGQLIEKIDDLNTEISSLQDKIKDIEDEKKRLQDQNTDLNREREQLQLENETLQGDIQQLHSTQEMRMRQQEEAMKSEIAARDQDNVNLILKIYKLEKEKERLTEKAAEFNQRLEIQESKIQDQSEAYNQLQIKLNDMNQRYENTRQTVQKKDADLQKQRESLQNKDRSIANIKKEKENLEAELKRIKASNAEEKSKLTAQMTQIEGDRERLSKETELLKRTQENEMQKLKTELQELRDTTLQQSAQINRCEMERKYANECMERSIKDRQEMEYKIQMFQILQQEYKRKEEYVQKLLNENGSLNEMLKQTSTYREHVQRYYQTVQTLQVELQRERERNQHMNEYMSNQGLKLDHLTRECNTYRALADSNRNTTDQLREEKFNLVRQLDKSNNEIEGLKRERDNLAKEVFELKDQIRNFTAAEQEEGADGDIIDHDEENGRSHGRSQNGTNHSQNSIGNVLGNQQAGLFTFGQSGGNKSQDNASGVLGRNERTSLFTLAQSGANTSLFNTNNLQGKGFVFGMGKK